MGERGESMGKPDFCLCEVLCKLKEEFDEQILSPFSNWYQGIFACIWIFSHLSVMPLIAMPIWTLVNSDTASNEMILCFGGVWIFFILSMKSKLFLIREITSTSLPILWMKFDIGHMTTTSPFTAVDSLDPIFHPSGTHFDKNVGNFALDVVFEVA